MEKFEILMRRCLENAAKYRFEVAPNPMVGAIIYDEAQDLIISEGVHKKYGEAHAEVDAINNAPIDDFSQMTLVVNLEPCSHQGKTPPCADLIARLGFKKVVIGAKDKNPLVKGMGIQKLKDAGIEVITGVLEDECVEFNKVFFKNIEKKLPYVMLKIATTFDSKIATLSGESKWITSEESRERVQHLRSDHFGILSGCGTVLADNPNLNCRLEGLRSPDRIIIDRYGKIPFTYNVFKDDGTRVFVATNNLNRNFPKNVIPIEFVDFGDLFSKLYEFGIYSIFVETGKTILSAIIKQKQADEFCKFLAPKVFGSGLDFVSDIDVNKIDEALHLEFGAIERVGEDILINAKILDKGAKF